jgi:hypothetical protein
MRVLTDLLTVVLALPGFLCPVVFAAEPAEETFQKGAKLLQSGDTASALKLFISAAQSGNSKAAVQVGWCYEFAPGGSPNYSEVAKWYRKGAELGNSTGQKNLGALYERGQGVAENWVEAASWYRKSAMQNNPEGQSALARAYQFGIGVPQSRSEAIAWDRRAAALGDSDAAYFLRWLSSPTNNIGFRNAAERNLVIGFRMVDVIVLNEPAGTVFHNSAERNGYLLQVARRLDGDQAYSRWWLARAEYTQCESSHRSGCRDPGPEPRQ